MTQSSSSIFTPHIYAQFWSFIFIPFRVSRLNVKTVCATFPLYFFGFFSLWIRNTLIVLLLFFSTWSTNIIAEGTFFMLTHMCRWSLASVRTSECLRYIELFHTVAFCRRSIWGVEAKNILTRMQIISLIRSELCFMTYSMNSCKSRFRHQFYDTAGEMSTKLSYSLSTMRRIERFFSVCVRETDS